MVGWHYRCLLRTTSYGYVGYKSRLRTTGWLWRLPGLEVDKQISSVVVATGVRWRPPGYCCGFIGRRRTTKLAFSGLYGMLMPHIVM